jgi:hypothetical protein
MLINPRRKRRRRNPSGRRMPAGLRRYWASRRGKRLSNPRRRARSRRRNPIRRRRGHARRRNPIFRSRRRSSRRRGRFLRNPRELSMSNIGHSLIAAGIGAAGGMALAYGMGYVSPYLPASLQTGLVQSGVQLVGALGIGMVAGKFLGSETGQYVTFGALTIVLYNALTSVAAGAGMTLPSLSGYSDYRPYRMGAYMAGSPPRTAGFKGLGWVSPAPVLQPRMSGLGAYMKQAPMNVAPSFGNYGDGM